MPEVLWPLFQRNRHLLHDLPILGAQVLQQWARQKYGIRLMIVVIPHTFGRHLKWTAENLDIGLSEISIVFQAAMVPRPVAPEVTPHLASAVIK